MGRAAREKGKRGEREAAAANGQKAVWCQEAAEWLERK
jgi:hypothetical protein